VDEGYLVGVLPDCVGFGEVGELRARIAAAGQLAVELGEGDQRQPQLAGQLFETPGDESDFQPPVFDTDAGG
jgi:hypothetical protein